MGLYLFEDVKFEKRSITEMSTFLTKVYYSVCFKVLSDPYLLKFAKVFVVLQETTMTLINKSQT